MLGIAIGFAGIATLAPPLKMLGVVFGLGQIVWFAWVGAWLLRLGPDAIDTPVDVRSRVQIARTGPLGP